MNPTPADNVKPEILVVDDMPANLALLSSILKQKGYKVRAVTNGNIAIQSAFAAPPDLILLDILMPVIDGYDVCQKLKANPLTSEIPVIFLSALSEGVDKAKAFKSGGIDYITKPFEVEEVFARVENQLKQRFLQKELRKQSETLHQQNLQLQAEINSRHLLESKLYASEQKLRAIFEAMTDIVIAVNIQEGQIGDIDILPTNWQQLYDNEIDLVSQIIEQFFQVETSSIWLDILQQSLGMSHTLNFDYTIRIKDRDICLAVTVSPLGNHSAMLVARDITDRKLAEEALRIAQERYHSIVENALEGIFQSSPEGRYLSVNPALASIYGYSSPEELLASVKDIQKQLYVEPKRREEFVDVMEKNNTVSAFESMVYRKDGSVIWISETARAVRDSTGKLLYYEGIVSNITDRKIAQEALKFQQAQTEELLLSILPQPIATRLRSAEFPIADYFEDASVLFADLVGFTQFSAEKKPRDLVKLLNEIFSEFDRLAEKYQLEKIKTIGDAYMVVGGLPIPRLDAPEAIAQMALDMQQALAEFNHKNSESFQLRIGIHIGPVVAGVIGKSKFIYDLWGDTVNIASRMESNGLPGKIQVSSATKERLNQQFEFEERGKILVKGKGEMVTYWLVERVKGEG